MSINISLDFDGVCTDLSFVKQQKINEFDYLYSPFSITLSEKRKGVFELISVFGLFADIFIITSRPVEDKIYIKKWLLEKELLPFIKDILCCGESPKSVMMNQHEIKLLIDDKPKHLVLLDKKQKGILWEHQSWIDVAKEFINFTIADSNASIKVKPELILTEVDYTTDLSSSPVFILKFNDKSKLKLRVCANEQVKNRIISFLKITKENRYNHVSCLVATNGLAILKTFIEGVGINSINANNRLIFIEKAGSALAKLHSIQLSKPISDLKFSLADHNESLLVFSADNYNLIITSNNDVAFIDLEACNVGSRWIDYCWTEKLLCQNDDEKLALEKGYFSIYTGMKATNEESKLAEQNYKLWLTYQLRQSKSVHSSDSGKAKIIDETLSELWN